MMMQPTPLPKLEIASTIIKAIELLSKVPALATEVKKLGISVSRLFAARSVSVATGSALDTIIERESKRLQDLIDQFFALDDNDRYDELEKDRHRKRVSAQACALLKSADPVKDRIPDYEKLIKFFCESVPSTLMAA